MPVEFHYNDANTWRKLSEMHYFDGVLGDWRELDGVWYNDDGTWRRVFDNRTVSLNNTNAGGSRDTSGGVGTATGAYEVRNDGAANTIQNTNANTDSTTTTGVGDNWWTGKPQATIGDDYEVRATQTDTTGLGTFTGTLDTWEDITVTRNWQLQDTGNNVERTSSRTLLIEIRDALTMTVQGSASIKVSSLLFGP